MKQHLLESAPPPAQQSERDGNLAVRQLQRRGWVTVRELAEELRFTVTAPAYPEQACRDWLQREGIGSVKRGRVILVARVDVDRALRAV